MPSKPTLKPNTITIGASPPMPPPQTDGMPLYQQLHPHCLLGDSLAPMTMRPYTEPPATTSTVALTTR